MADIRFRRIVATLGVVAFVATSASSALAGATPAQKCAASRQKAAGKKIKAKMGCQSKAKAKNTAVDPACLTKAEAKFSSAFAKTSGCPGTASGIESLVDSCVATLTGDAPGNGKCPSSTAKAEGKAGSCELGCTAKEITDRKSVV